MESDHVYKTSRSLREGSSSIQRNNAMDAFSTSSRKENDEEAPEWTALEKSTTSDSSGKQILTASPGDENEIDVNNLGLQESHKLINRLVKVPEVDNEKFLLKIMNRFERQEFLSFYYTKHAFISFCFFFVVLFSAKTEQFCSASWSSCSNHRQVTVFRCNYF